MKNVELYELADRAKENAYAPFSNFKVGSALLTESGKVYTGVNIENSSYGGTICAERVAFVKAVSEGERDFVSLAIASSGGEAMPCGICRQFMYEFCPELNVITGKDKESLREHSLNELLPEGFRLEKK